MTMTNEQIQALRDTFEILVMKEINISKETLIFMRTDDGYKNITFSGRDYNHLWKFFLAGYRSSLAEHEADKALIAEQAKRIAELEEREKRVIKLVNESGELCDRVMDAMEARTLTVKLPLESLPKTEAFWSVMYDLMYQTKRKPHENWNVSLAFSEAKELAAYLNEVMPFRDAAGITLVVEE